MGPREELNDLRARVVALEGTVRVPEPLFVQINELRHRMSAAETQMADLQKRVTALEAAPVLVPSPNVVQLTREQFDQLVESLNAMYELTGSALSPAGIADLHDIAAEALERAVWAWSRRP